jgi:Zn-dependent peptidase ImmA (M78 family)
MSASFHEETSCGGLQMGRIEVSRPEMEADLFAAYLLVPDLKLRPVLEQSWIKETDDPVLRLALEFQVPC